MLPAKRCGRCGKSKPAAEYYKSRRAKDGLQNYCRHCSLESVKQYQARVGKSVVHRSVKYRLDRRDVAAMMAIPVCQSCGDPFADSHSMKFDHCHSNGHWRGVICHACNMACSGTSRVAVGRLRACISYLTRDLERNEQV